MIARRATVADVPEIVRVINLAYVVEAAMFHGERTSDADVRERMTRPNAGFLTVPDDTPGASPETLVGSVYVETRGERGYFGMLAVDPAAQGRGLGRALIRAAEEFSRGLACTFMDLDVVDLRAELTTFYESLGYASIGESPYPHASQTKRPVRLIHMTKAI